MARGIQIPFTLNPREFLRGLRTIGDGLDDVSDDFRDLEKAGDRAADDLERTWDRAGDRIEDSFRGVADKAEDQFDRMKRTGRRAGDDLNQGFQQGWRSTSVGVIAAEAADEFVESWGEAVRAGDLSEALYETITNAGQIMAAALPGIGTVIGMGVATVGGIAQGIREEQQRIQEAITGAISSAGDQTIEDQGYQTGKEYIAGVNRALSDEATSRAALQDYYGTDSFIEALTEATTQAEQLGVGFDDVERIISGTTDDLNTGLSILGQQRDVLNNQITAAYDNADGSMDNMTAAQQEQLVNLTKQRDGINALIGVGKKRLGQIKQDAATMDKVYGATTDTSRATQVWGDRLGAAAQAAGQTATNTGRIRDPSLTRLQQTTAMAAINAERAARAIAGIPTQKTVTITTELGGAYRGKRLPI